MKNYESVSEAMKKLADVFNAMSEDHGGLKVTELSAFSNIKNEVVELIKENKALLKQLGEGNE